MPVYEYRCERGHTFEVLQRMSEHPVTDCEVCSLPVQRVMHPVAIHFKGSGFYTTDYARKKDDKAAAGAESSDGAKGDGAGKAGDSGSDTGAGKKAEPAKKAEAGKAGSAAGD